ncbi:antibiotic biosynthesis monooxygenase [Lewinella lacunae]|uniref:Antibiotic biosynthesis monooxygenase n=2 Tax=Neolewinella lacunae TaxID=1517758 RepID=A0A923T5X6_9BACT|nr:antibiotic biosynthesis monooxygenase [Neolewinella lacunae]MBC6992800.1 antibiotic biosynthesis monooxygenase [Neolewinella lacunae]
MMIRIAEIEVDSAYLDDYIAILKEEAAASVLSEPGVICIYPMFQRETPSAVRLLEIYASQAAYESHLQSPHFLHYKSATRHMVKSLNLIDMEAIDPLSMSQVFAKVHAPQVE